MGGQLTEHGLAEMLPVEGAFGSLIGPTLPGRRATGLTAAQRHDPGFVANPGDLVESEHAGPQDKALIGILGAEKAVSHSSKGSDDTPRRTACFLTLSFRFSW